MILPGVSAYPRGGGTIAGPVCREAMGQVVGRIGDVEVILADGPTAFTDPRQLEPCGIDPLSRKLVVVKEGYLYAALTRIAPRHIMLLTPGAGDMRIERLTYMCRRKPVFPFEPDTSFDPEAAPA